MAKYKGHKPPKQESPAEPNQVDILTARIARWQVDWCAFFEEALGVRLSNQQRLLVMDAQRLFWAKVNASEGRQLSKEDAELAKKLGISVHSGKGLGKDFIIAGIIILVIFLFRPFKGICTAKSAKQLEDVLSNEVRKLLKNSPAQLWKFFVVDKGGIYLLSGTGKSTNFMAKRTANVKGTSEEQAETLAGYHERFMIMVVDEASGVPDPIFRPLETTLTGYCNFAILIGNPTRNTGYFYRSHYNNNDRALWHVVHWDAEKSDLDSFSPGLKAQIERIELKYGRESNPFRINVLGLPPQTESDALISLHWIYAAVDRWADMPADPEIEPVVLGVDIGRGGDDSAIAHRIGGKIVSIETKNSPDTSVVADWLDLKIESLEPDDTVIDSCGLGGPFCDFFRRSYHRSITELNVAEGASNNLGFKILRDELWWRVRDAFEQGKIGIPDDEELINELMSLKVIEWEPIKRVISKKKLKSMGVPSPNRADAIMHTYHKRPHTMQKAKAQNVDKYRSRRDREADDKHAWMVA